MASTIQPDTEARPGRGAVFSEVPAVRRVLTELREVGFDASELFVVSDSERVREEFPNVQSKPRAGSYSPAAVLMGSVGGLLAGGVLAAVVYFLIPAGDEGIGVRWVAALIAPLVALTGGFVGAMVSRGAEVEATNFYDQSLLGDQILVVAEGKDAADPRLDGAEAVFARHGAEAMPLSRG